MEKNFLITEISNVYYVTKDLYPEKSTAFPSDLERNELIFHVSGKATVYFGGEVLKTSPNTVRFLPEGHFSRYEVVRDEGGECFVVYFKTDRPVSPVAFVRDVSDREHIAGLFGKMLSCWTARGEGHYFECISLLYKIFAELEKRNYMPKNRFDKIKPAVDAINFGFLRKNFSSEELAELCGISQAYLKRLFNQKFGVPPKKYAIRLKINHALGLLRLGLYTVTEVAELSGFSDVYFFSRQFKKYTGLSPSEFVKRD